VSRWESRGPTAVPLPFNQQSLDICLQRCSGDERERFAMQLRALTRNGYEGGSLAVVQRCLSRRDMREALADRNIAKVFRILNAHGMPQREIAALTGQSQSEISEILAGRRVMAYDVLARVADGLGVPRGHMGLAYDTNTQTLLSDGIRRQ
jgi:hypothetical protein